MCWFVNISLEQVLRFFFASHEPYFQNPRVFEKCVPRWPSITRKVGSCFLCWHLLTYVNRVLISNYQLYATIGHHVWSLMKISRQSSNSYTGVSWSLWLWSSHGLGVALVRPHARTTPHPPTMVLSERVECVSGRQKPDNRPHTHTKNLIVFEKNKRFDKKTEENKNKKCLLLHF